ncbi:TetR/AcrR family transcriptional regulator [Microlunatus flavus]|uniref:DNA-binding transcriptional regulator, AcrR family n=1 Tax=Microlunatus flavus TaxID=1036181 RepID=A0A1H9L6A9_9ACTN|nr:TetR/AcrR family transcriptional regulator [Microlunatus flavus]SER06695.1 DNA-binding transcriptional regulator, AcrR family [Microlunatus flavus]
MARPRKFDEDEVVGTALRQFSETGYHGTSVEDLSRVTGLSKGSLYGAFGDKEALFHRVFDAYCSAAGAHVAARVEGPEDEALQRLRDWLRSSEDRPGQLACLLAKGTAELASEDEVVAARSLATFEMLFDSCRRLVEQAQRAGHVDPDADPAVLGQLVVTTHRGLEALARGGVDTSTLNRIADAAIDAIATPVRPRSSS